MRRWISRLFVMCAMLLAWSCLPHHEPPVPPPVRPAEPRLDPSRISRLIPEKVTDRQAWARDIHAILLELDRSPTPRTVASVLAVIEQESGFNANPLVPGLADIVQKRLEAYSAKLGPLGRPALSALLKGKAPAAQLSFEERLKRVRTERDLDRIFRDLLTYYETAWPTTFAAANLLGDLFASQRLEDLNPITTAGSMQVSVRFALELARKQGKTADQVREELYTRRGGLYYGMARLLGYEADYPQPIYRFADYNAGFYASRNAALQAQVSRLTGIPLTPDGDLLIYDKQGRPADADSSSMRAILAFRQKYAPELSESRVRRDLRLEKERAFEETETWKAIKQTYAKTAGEKPTYARLPDVAIVSPKLKGERSTAWFARSVDRRFQKFLSLSQSLP